MIDEPTERHGNGPGIHDDQTSGRLSLREIRAPLAESDNDIAAGRTYREADVRAYVADMRAERADEKAAETDDSAVDLGAVTAAIASADQATIDDGRTETDLWEVAELATADADYTSGNTVSGEDFRHRYGLS